MSTYEKSRTDLSGWLDGRAYYKASKALNLARSLHTGQRRDGNPELSHPLAVALFVRTISDGLKYPQETIATALLHDSVEDHNLNPAIIRTLCGRKAERAVMLLTKVIDGRKLDTADYYNAISQDIIASIVKGADRIHNLQTMVGPFSFDKQIAYVRETRDFVLPMLKIARGKFPKQKLAYYNIKHMLTSQLELIEAIHAHIDHGKSLT